MLTFETKDFAIQTIEFIAKSLFLPDFLNEFSSLCFWLKVFSQWFHLKTLHIVSQTKKHHF